MRAHIRLLLATLLVAASAAAASGCGGSAASAKPRVKLDAAGELTPPRQAPDIALRDWTGSRVQLKQFRGKAVLLTFIYDHCPDTCPLIVDKLRQAQVELGSRAHELQIVAVSVDPKGDTPRTVASFLTKHRMTGRMDYLIGTQKELEPVWHAYGIGSESSPESREVSHTALVYGITSTAGWLALYDQSFQPQEVAHDVPLLAAM